MTATIITRSILEIQEELDMVQYRIKNYWEQHNPHETIQDLRVWESDLIIELAEALPEGLNNLSIGE